MGARPRLVVMADWALVGEAIRSALVSRSIEPITVSWPRSPRQIPEALRGVVEHDPDALLLVCDLAMPLTLDVACRLIEGVPAPPVVLTGAPQGPGWGAVLTSGGDSVLPSTASLDDVTAAVLPPHQHRFRLADGLSRRLQRQWREIRLEQGEMVGRVQLLTPRELVVLRMICEGESVRSIALSCDVAETTVRSQVKSVLRKLGVRSQLTAVAAYRQLVEQGRPTS